jgi:hypothetical protein
MLIDLYNRLTRQKRDPKQTADAFMTAWRVLHMLLRLFYLNKLCDDAVVRRLAAKPMNREALADFQRREMAEVNKADEKNLFGSVAIRLVGIDLKARLQAEEPALWEDYERAATQMRHFHAHAKVYVRSRAKLKPLAALLKSLERLMARLDGLFTGDSAYDNARMGAPPPPIFDMAYDPKTGLLTISEDPEMAGAVEW